MNWIYTNSSTMNKFKYDAQSQLLTIFFTSGETYNYYNVPLSVFEGLNKASSKGQFFNNRIRDHFRYGK